MMRTIKRIPWLLPVAAVALLLLSALALLLSLLALRPEEAPVPAPRPPLSGDLKIEEASCGYLPYENSAIVLSLEVRVGNRTGETLDTEKCWILASTDNHCSFLELPERLRPGESTFLLARWFRRVPEGYVEGWGPEIGENSTFTLDVGIYTAEGRDVSSMLRGNGTLLVSREFSFRYPRIY